MNRNDDSEDSTPILLNLKLGGGIWYPASPQAFQVALIIRELGELVSCGRNRVLFSPCLRSPQAMEPIPVWWVGYSFERERKSNHVCGSQSSATHSQTHTPHTQECVKACLAPHSSSGLTSVWPTLGCLNKGICVRVSLLAGCLEGRCSRGLLLLKQAENKRSITQHRELKSAFRC